MAAGEWNSIIEQGATWTKTLVITDSNGDPRDLTGYTARSHMRRYVTAESAEVELTEANGRVIMTPLAGQIVLTLDKDTTAALAADPLYHDVEIEDGSGVVERILQGKHAVSGEVTRE